MQYTRFGKTGLEVSRLCFGCMSFGKYTDERPWVLGLDEARPLFRAAWEAGINFYDTANVYAEGSSEEITGALLRELGKREDYVLATKVFFRMHDRPNGAGLSRKAIFAEIDNSLKRLGTDYVDLYQIHRFDPDTPIEETMEALNDVVKAGKARYIGASSMWTWQFAQMQFAAERNGWPKFISMQNQVSLAYREEEREMIPFCMDTGVAVMPWSPLAGGLLTRPWAPIPSASTPTATTAPCIRTARKPIAPWLRPSKDWPVRRASPWPFSPWPGCSISPASPARSSAPRSSAMSRTPLPRSTSP